MPIQDQTINWPFFAVDVFTTMGVPHPTDDDEDNNDAVQNTNTVQTTVDDNLATLITLGFNDETKNREILTKFNNDLDQAVNYYLDNGSPAGGVNLNDTTDPTAIQDDSFNTSSATSETDMLISLGFCDDAKNRKVLAKFNNDVSQAINYFLDNPNGDDADNAEVVEVPSIVVPDATVSSSSRLTKIAAMIADPSLVTIDLIDDDSDCPGDESITIAESGTDLPDEIAEWALDLSELQVETEVEAEVEAEDCPICYNETPSSSWQTLECNHKLCTACYTQLLTRRVTMSGILHTFVKCPFCHAIFGTEIGTCPDMTMSVSTQHIPCDGYNTFSTLVIDYSGPNIKRTAYLPNNDVGREVLKLLQLAFDRRLCFTVGTSNTTGQENAIVWNIHHKTATHGGVASYGYPDPEYFDRVKSELKEFGIK